MSSVFANGPGHQGSIPGQVIPKTLKLVLVAALFNIQYYKVRIKGKMEQYRIMKKCLPLQLGVVAIEKKDFESPSTTVANFTLLIYLLYYVRTQDVTLKTCRRRWMIGRSGERGSGISVLAARHDDDDDIFIMDVLNIPSRVNELILSFLQFIYCIFGYTNVNSGPWWVRTQLRILPSTKSTQYLYILQISFSLM